ncbi:MAG TPA: ribosome small subunit-dependent GTPase A [Pirellulaceae bacterium]|nr:ribosome small subunit-dependent GTPase A [Pirellulaceae bacterium]
MGRKRKIRHEFRKQHQGRKRQGDLTRQVLGDENAEDRLVRSERLTGKGDLTRKRTIVGVEADAETAGFAVLRDVDGTAIRGHVLSVHGLSSVVQADDGRQFRCAVRGVLKDLSTDLRHVVVAGDIVWIRPEATGDSLIERIEPRARILSRTSKGRQQILVANVDQLVIVTSAAEPTLKPNLIDRFLVEAEQMRIEPILCINKIDLVDPADLQPFAGVYGQMGYRVLLVSATTGQGIDQLRRLVAGKESVVAGQSGVGKSSLLNAIEPELALKVGEVSRENQKGKHTTTVARLIPLAIGGFVVDTPGIRQFQLWDIVPEEVAGLYRDIRPYVSRCRFPDCTHTHEADCAVKDAVADNRLDARRYESYCHVRAGDEE